MKHYSYLIAASAMLIAASCQKDSFEASEGGYVNVSFKTELPGVATKAVADGMTVNTLYYEVYTVDADGASVKCVYDGTAEVSAKTATVDVRLVKNKPYNVYFWAQYEAEGYTSPYTVDDLQNIEVSYDGALANDEGRDAFYKVLKGVTYAGENAETVYLNRAFAQVNVATADLAEVLRQNSRPVTSSLEISNLATSFNTFTGEGTGSEDAVFSAFYLPGIHSGNVDTYTVANVQDLMNVGAEKKSYDYLATAYVLVPAAEGYTSISSVKATVNYAADNSVQIIAPEATIQKNWRTNIFGDLLTASVDYNIEVDQEFENDHTAEVDKLAQLFANGGSMSLEADAFISKSVEIAAGVTVNLNLNGRTLTVVPAEDGTVTDIKNYGTLNLVGGKVVAKADEFSRRCIYNYGEMTIDGTEFVQTYNRKGAAINNEGKLTIEDATVNAVYYSIWTSGENAETIVNGGTFTTTNDKTVTDTWSYAINVQNGAKLVVNGGKFTGNHGVVNAVTGAVVVLNAGTFHCTADYTGNSDWTLYASGDGSAIYYDEDNCDITSGNASGVSYTKDGGVVKAILKSSSVSDLSSVADNSYVVLAEGSYRLPSIAGKTLTISGTKDVVVNVHKDGTDSQNTSGASITFEGITIQGATTNYRGFPHTKSVSFKNCTIKNLLFLYSTTTFQDCVFESSAEHCVWTYGAGDVTFTNCDFTYSDRCVNVYSENNNPYDNVTFTNCRFTTDNTGSEGAVEVNSSLYTTGVTVNLNECTAPAYGDMVFISKWDSKDGAKTTVYKDGSLFNAPIH